jgi:hypothetical protein
LWDKELAYMDKNRGLEKAEKTGPRKGKNPGGEEYALLNLLITCV